MEIVTEIVAGGSLRIMLSKLGKFDERIIALFVKQILEGLTFLHGKGFAHRYVIF
jgi:mitogen-activated protein kinase kinase kinase